MEVNERFFENPLEFLNFLSSWNNNLTNYVFRGHSSGEYQLVPSVLRENNRHIANAPFGKEINDPSIKNSNLEMMQIQSEFSLLRNFYKTADRHGLKVPNSEYLRKYLAGAIDLTFMLSFSAGDKWIPAHLLEIAALAQHYGLPTRLLDWTYDPFVAAHFALKGAIGRGGNLVVWCLNAGKISDELNFNSEFPLKIVTPPYFDNENLSAQKGLFTHIETEISTAKLMRGNLLVDRKPLDKFVATLPSNSLQSDKNFMIKLVMPCEFALQAYELLELHGYGEARIYPGYDGIVRQVMRPIKSTMKLENK
ncbi:FRG domain-containing protein [Pantoea brenneri]|uniref:FRG domain-containing protein n=1 Tax=Pantoea brenneri TaxID=472694 RepID=UPI00210A3712|nr:FRG domain-containing protein [Pantoea brenneri]MCQ5469352.1 FRG domain-containing protein [Pantoea brenneri]